MWIQNWVSLACFVTGVGWCVTIELWRGCSREDSARMFWLHRTAPIVAIVLMLVSLVLIVRTEFQK